MLVFPLFAGFKIQNSIKACNNMARNCKCPDQRKMLPCKSSLLRKLIQSTKTQALIENKKKRTTTWMIFLNWKTDHPEIC
jgi:hypothetical protein